jgi:hypothetical protein
VILTFLETPSRSWSVPLRDGEDARQIVAEYAEAEGLTHLWYAVNGSEYEFSAEEHDDGVA